MKLVMLSLSLFLSLAPATMPPGFSCVRQGNELHCTAKALSDTKRAPEWELYQDGGCGWIDRARGWDVVLYPNGQANHTVLMRGYLPHLIVILTCNAVGESGCDGR
jgi:hypothetical protein